MYEKNVPHIAITDAMVATDTITFYHIDVVDDVENIILANFARRYTGPKAGTTP